MGFLPIDRDIQKHWIYKDSQYLHVWIHMLLNARYAKDSKTFFHEGDLITVGHGEFIFGRISWEKELNVSQQRLRTLLKKLIAEEMIEVARKYPKCTVYLIKNYHKYNQQSNQQESLTGQGFEQHANQQSNTESTSSQPAANQQLTTKEESNKEIKVKRKSDSRQKRVYDEQSIPYRSANYLYTSILKHKPDLKKPNLQSWADDMRKLIEIDGRDPHQIANVINWVITEPFWHCQILSAAKLREKWDTLTAKMMSPRVVPINSYKSKAEKDAEQISALKQRILGGDNYEDINAARSRIDITTDQNGIPQLQFD